MERMGLLGYKATFGTCMWRLLGIDISPVALHM